MSDDMDRREGLACELCGDDPATWERINNTPVALCDGCYTDQTDTCPTCEAKFWQKDGYRIQGELICGSCGAAHPMVAGQTMAALMADSFNERRR